MPFYHHHAHHTLFFFRKSLRQIFWSAIIRQAGLSIVSVFSLIFIFKIGLEKGPLYFPQFQAIQMGFLLVVSYLFVFRSATLLSVLPLARWTQRTGLIKSVMMGNIAMAVKFGFFILTIEQPFFLFLAAIIGGVEMALYIPAYETLFAKHAQNGKVGRSVGIFQIVFRLTHAVTPVLAGLVAAFFGFSYGFFVALLFVTAANIPLFLMRREHFVHLPDSKAILPWKKKEQRANILLAMIGRYTSELILELWPIHLFILFGSLERVGAVVSIGLALSFLFSYLSGWAVDHGKTNKLFFANGALLSLVWFGRVAASTIPVVVGIEFAEKILGSMYYPSFDAMLFRFSKESHTFGFFVFRQLALSIFALGLITIVFIILLVSRTPWVYLFGLGAFGTLASTSLYWHTYERR